MDRSGTVRLAALDVADNEPASSSSLVNVPSCWPGLPLRLLHNPPQGQLSLPAEAEDRLLIQTAGETDLEGTLVHSFVCRRTGPGRIYLVPRDVPLQWNWSEPWEALQIVIPPGKLAATQRNLEQTVEEYPSLVARIAVSDPLLHQLALAMLVELQEGPPFGQFYVESLSQMLVTQLLRHYTNRTEASGQRKGRSAPTLRLVLDHIRDNLAQDLSLATVAALAGISPFHFARRFREATGCSLHDYVHEQRLAEARRLLLRKDLTIAAVAALTGFADQSHLSRDFKRRFGVTPGSLRRGD
ncbi:MAG: helix-turn-helix transcriptional regulator [Chloroflexi bacterium]|nr:helix-turn-helix transcriptional regulator [Chloroflexota bacterium]